jgi:thiamine-phosphate pyrophosphorylase
VQPPGSLEARDTIHDVGTSVTARGEYERESPVEVARVSFKRLQEALRSLEEYGKIRGQAIAGSIERLRYRSYTLERAVLGGGEASARLMGTRLCVLLSGAQCVAGLDWTIQEAAAGGAGMIQLREKGVSDRELLERARNVRRWTRKANVLFIVNDRPDIARLVEADGVHLGQDDLPVAEARRIVGIGPLIGVSTHDIEQVRRAVLEGASYIGVGPTFPSATKSFPAFAGLDLIREVAASTSLPFFAIGGIQAENVNQVVAAGARRIAVSAAIARADEPRAIAGVLYRALLHQAEA